ncbi:MAG: hypothetical protein V2G42_03275 [bacterium JZ-2024 1]
MSHFMRAFLAIFLPFVFVSATPADNPLVRLANLIGSAKTEKEFFEKELHAWGKLYIGEAVKTWNDEFRNAYQPVYWRNAMFAYFSACSFVPEKFPATLDDLRKSGLLPFLPYDIHDSTPYSGDFLTTFALPPEKQDPAILTPEDRAEIAKNYPPGSLSIYRKSETQGDQVRWSLGYILTWYDTNSRTNKTDARTITYFPANTEAQPLRCLTNQMVFYILGYYATTGNLPSTPEDLDKKVALLNPAVWQDKKNSQTARKLWDALLAEGKK